MKREFKLGQLVRVTAPGYEHLGKLTGEITDSGISPEGHKIHEVHFDELDLYYTFYEKELEHACIDWDTIIKIIALLVFLIYILSLFK